MSESGFPYPRTTGLHCAHRRITAPRERIESRMPVSGGCSQACFPEAQAPRLTGYGVRPAVPASNRG
jgi:hypothetical protein